ncbi:MAG: hypothetical protein R6V58_15250 [Planctomycetota bacterium]
MNRNHSLSAIATALGFVLSAGLAAGQTPLHTRVSVDYRNLAAAEALKDLGAKAGVRFVGQAALFKGLDHVTLKADGQEAGRVAMRILYPRGLEMKGFEGRQVTVAKAAPFREFKPKREEVFEFARKPVVTRRGDTVTIAFQTEGWCDVTVAIEDDRGSIVRHLASGVLGPNAPEPFLWNSKAQTLVWDGKDDAGVYVDDKDRCVVRVSLGLKPRFERTLFWHPGKPSAQGGYSAFRGQRLALTAVPEGVLVFDSGQGVDHLRLFDRDGNYLRTIYPFPNATIVEVEGLIYHQFPDGPNLPIKPNWLQSTFLQSDTNCVRLTYQDGQYRGYQSKDIATGGITGAAGNTLATAAGKIALVGRRFSRLATDGTSGGLNLHGPEVTHRPERPLTRDPRRGRGTLTFIRPQRAALSPDAKYRHYRWWKIRCSGNIR